MIPGQMAADQISENGQVADNKKNKGTFLKFEKRKESTLILISEQMSENGHFSVGWSRWFLCKVDCDRVQITTV